MVSPSPTAKPTDIYTANSDEFYTQLYTAVPIGIFLSILYCIVRLVFLERCESRRREDRERTGASSPDPDIDDNDDEMKAYWGFPNISDSAYIGWIWEVIRMDSNTFYEHAGFDALVLILLLKGIIKVCLVCLPFTLFVLLPVYGTSEHDTHDLLDILSLSTIHAQSHRMIATIIGAFMVTKVTMYFFNNIYLQLATVTDMYWVGSTQIKGEIDAVSYFKHARESFAQQIDVLTNKVRLTGQREEMEKGINGDQSIDEVELGISDNNDEKKDDDEFSEYDDERLSHSKDSLLVTPVSQKDAPTIQHYTVMIRSLPLRLRKPGALTKQMEELFDDVARVYIVPDVKELMEIEVIVKEHESQLKSLAKEHGFKYDDIFNGNDVPEIRGKLKCFGKCGAEVNLIAYHKKEYEDAVHVLNETKEAKPLELTNTAFVTFKSLESTTIFVQSTKPLDFLTTDVSMAPPPGDIYWEHLMFDPTLLKCRKFLISILMSMLLIFWSIPVIAIQGLANLQSLYDLWDGNALNDFSQTQLNFVSGFLSVLVLDIYMALLPTIMELFSNILKPSHRGQHEIAIMSRFYTCLVFMIMLVTVMASTFLSGGSNIVDYFKNFTENIEHIADLLGEGLASMSIYFLLYILLNTFMTLPKEWFRLSYHFYEYWKFPEANRFLYAVWIPKILLIFTIVLTYSIMNPIMLIFGLFYFVMAYTVLKYHLSMSWVPALTMGPETWVKIFNLVRYSYVIAQITLYGMLILKSYVGGIVMLPLLYYCWNNTKEIMVRFEPLFKSASLTSAKHTDSKYPAREEMFELKNPYQPPVLVTEYRLSD